MLSVPLAFLGFGTPSAEERRRFRLAVRVTAPMLPLAMFLYLCRFVPEVAAGQSWGWTLPGAATVGPLAFNFDLLLDGLSLLFALIITGIGFLVLLYAGSYMGEDERSPRLILWLLLFMVSMLGVVLSRNLFALFVFWELTGITSYMLIGFNHEEEESRASSLQALLVTGVGGLALLAGLVMLALAAGSADVLGLQTAAGKISESELYLPLIALILLGAFTKSAQFPFHFWLPGAMAAPTPVSAYLHSATMVKAGIFLVARLTPAVGERPEWQVAVTLFGAVTAVVGACLAWQQRDLKRILAFSTISALGLIMSLLGFGTPLAMKAGLTFLLAHALYKGALFLVAGSVDHGTHTRDISELGGLFRKMPWTGLAAVAAAVSLAGVPPAMGFLGKEIALETALESPYHLLLTAAFVLASISFVAVAGMVAVKPFVGSASTAAAGAHESPPAMLFGPLLLAAMGLTLAWFPVWLGDNLIAPAMSATLASPQQVKLALWHGVNLPLLLSGTSLLLGGMLYLSRDVLSRMVQPLRRLDALGPEAAYRRMLAGLKWFALVQTRVLQNGRLRAYVFVTVATLCGLIAVVWWQKIGSFSRPTGDRAGPYDTMICAIMLIAAVAACRVSSRLAAVCLLGAIGYGVAMLFVLFGAPDLAMTQFSIETLTVILFVFVLYRLPRFTRFTSTAVRVRDAVIAVTFGTVMAALVFSVTQHAFVHDSESLKHLLSEAAYTEAHGRNVVNVILVDFRALDTLGEIVVLAVAAIGIYGLMRLRLGEEQKP